MFPFPIIIAGIRSPIEPLVVNAGSNLQKNGSGGTECGNVGNTATPGASVSGGTPPYTYLWEQTGTPAESGPYNCSNSAILNPTWGEPSVCWDDSPKVETWRLTVTDDNGIQDSDTITVTLNWNFTG